MSFLTFSWRRESTIVTKIYETLLVLIEELKFEYQVIDQVIIFRYELSFQPQTVD